MVTNDNTRGPSQLERGHGCWFIDASRREVLNFSASALGVPLGYGANVVGSAILQALETSVPGISGCELEHDICDRLASVLARFKPPSYDRTTLLFPSSGHALAAAHRVAAEHTCRKRVISVSSSCHGREMQHVSYGSRAAASNCVQLHQENAIYMPLPGAPKSPITNTEAFISHLHEFVFKSVAHPFEIAALVVPPVTFSESMLLPPDDFLPTISKLCAQHGILLIIDETRLAVAVLGKRFACDLWDFQPDILCLGEGCANGLSFGATIVLKSLLDFDLCHLGEGSQCMRISCAVASAILKQSESTLTASARRIEAHLGQQLNGLVESKDLVENVSGKGALWSLSLVERRASSPECLTLRDEVAKLALERGLFVAKTGTRSLIVAPPLVVSDSELEQGLHILEEVLTELA